MRRFGYLAGLALAAAFPIAASAQAAGGESQTYVMRSGDTLIRLAQLYLVSEAAALEVQRLNRIADARRIPVGTRLAIPRRLLRSEPIELRLQSFSGPVAVSHQGQQIAPRAGAIVPEGATIVTGANGFASVAAADGSRIALPSNSEARFARARRYLIDRAADIDVDVRRGRTEVRAAPQNPGGTFRVRTPVAVSAVRGTDFRAGLSSEGDLGLTEVLEGNVGVSTAAREEAVGASFGAAARSTGEIATEALLPAPALIAPGRVQTDETVSFNIQPMVDARRYRLQVARDAGFLEVLAEGEASGTSVAFAGIGNGAYFVRANAIAASGLAGLSETWSFRRQRVGLGADAAAAGQPGAFRFAWESAGDGLAIYRFQLFADPAGVPLVDEAGLEQTSLGLTGLKPGAYHWRVGVIRTDAAGSAEVWMPLQKINISS